jgi:hypothetical protein
MRETVNRFFLALIQATLINTLLQRMPQERAKSLSEFTGSAITALKRGINEK